MGWLRDRKERRLDEAEALRSARRVIDEDITVFGERLGDLHIETMTTRLDEEMSRDYQQALDHYERAKAELAVADELPEVVRIEGVLTDGRYHLACVLARRDGEELPARREACFFNPQHGPGTVDVQWAPLGGTERTIAVCRADANRLEHGLIPDSRMVRVGDRLVPWYAAGGAVDTLAQQRSQSLYDAPGRGEMYVAMAGLNALTRGRH